MHHVNHIMFQSQPGWMRRFDYVGKVVPPELLGFQSPPGWMRHFDPGRYNLNECGFKFQSQPGWMRHFDPCFSGERSVHFSSFNPSRDGCVILTPLFPICVFQGKCCFNPSRDGCLVSTRITATRAMSHFCFNPCRDGYLVSTVRGNALYDGCWLVSIPARMDAPSRL